MRLGICDGCERERMINFSDRNSLYPDAHFVELCADCFDQFHIREFEDIIATDFECGTGGGIRVMRSSRNQS